jgi:hypothetical protein
VLTRPDVNYNTDPELLETCYRLWAVSGFRDIPNPYEVAMLPLGYVSEIFAMKEHVQFYEDAPKRPEVMR